MGGGGGGGHGGGGGGRALLLMLLWWCCWRWWWWWACVVVVVIVLAAVMRVVRGWCCGSPSWQDRVLLLLQSTRRRARPHAGVRVCVALTPARVHVRARVRVSGWGPTAHLGVWPLPADNVRQHRPAAAEQLRQAGPGVGHVVAAGLGDLGAGSREGGGGDVGARTCADGYCMCPCDVPLYAVLLR